MENNYDDPNYLLEEYYYKERSTYDIAEEHGVYAVKIARLLRRYGIPRRDKSLAQARALETKRAKHPTAGQHRDEDTKEKISKSRAKTWEDPEARLRKSKESKKQWEEMSDEKKQEMSSLAAKAIKDAAKYGSKLEKHLFVRLGKKYKVVFHPKNLENAKLETDLLVPELKIAIELDGPTHFDPIFGEKRLAKQRKADTEKNGLLIRHGYHVIRVKCKHKTFSLHYGNKVLQLLGDMIEWVSQSPTLDVHEVEV